MSPAVHEPWRREATDVAAALASDPERGLSAAEAATRLMSEGANALAPPARVPAWRRLAAQLADPLVVLLLAATAVALAAWAADGAHGAPVDAIVIAVIVVLNAVLGVAQEAKAEQAVAALRELAVAAATVVRDGRERRVPATDVVPGDLLVLGEGDAVAADARLVDAAGLSVAEAALTGESAAVLKDPATLDQPLGPADRLNMVFSGTAVTRGRGRAVVTATGMATELGEVARLLGRTRRSPTPLQREVGRIGRALGVAVVAIAIVVVATILVTADVHGTADVVAVLLVGVSLAVAAVPEGLPAVLSVVLALGVQRMARRNAIVRRLASVETLGSASVICSDKTGTLTRNEMTIVALVTASGEVDVTGGGYVPEGEVVAGGRPLEEGALLDEVRALLGGGSLASDATLAQAGGGRWTITGDPTEAAFLVAEAKVAGLAEARRGRFERVAEIPFTSESRVMTTLQADARAGGDLAVVTKGAPDALLARCAGERVAGAIRPLDDARRAAVMAAVDRLADRALRTLAVAYRPLPGSSGAIGGAAVERELILLGLVGIADPPRPEARAAIAEAAEAGVRVIMMTGDHPRTAARIAAELGIAPPGAPVLTGADLERLDDDALRAALAGTSVCARVAPVHKLRVVAALQAGGEVVAMTGDGVNDAPALKSADIGVAMGVAGTDVAKQAADMVLADDDVATIVTAVGEGRAIVSGIRKFLRFLLSSNAGEVLTMLLGAVLAGGLGLEDTGEAVALPLLATQILWINLLTDTAPALAIGVDPPPADLMRRRPRRLGEPVIDLAMWVGILWVGVVMAVVTLVALDLGLDGGWLGGSGGIEQARTMAFTTLVLAQLFNCFNARSDRRSAFAGLFANRWLWGAVALSAALQVAVVQLPLLQDAFHTVGLSAGDWLVCVALASVVLVADELKKLVERRWPRLIPG
ncbi:MAG TPA: cation-translocating P-type ATPase [Baekduia sp.]|nr:cation-translocating P-type ATPase [Baekduia sp.]